jgi:alpha-galactosidase
MRPTKIVFIGAASVSFGPAMIHDALLTPELRGSTLWLVDIDGESLEVMAAYARRLNGSLGAGLEIKHTTDRAEALPDAEFVITSFAVRRDDLWRLDFQIPLKYGLKQVLGENGGPGGLSHSLRNIPIILDIARDMERLCPNALLLNFTNPESRMCLAVSRYTNVRCVGLCHGIGMAQTTIGKALDLPPEEVDPKAAGLNHFTWVLDLRRKDTGEDLYPAFKQAIAEKNVQVVGMEGEYQWEVKLCRHLMETFGYFPSPSDDHVGEYLPYAWEYCGLEGYDFDAADRHREASWKRLRRVAAGDADGLPIKSSGEFAFPIIASMLTGRNDLILAVNVRNDGLIGNLPDWAIVEVPAIAAPDGVRGVHMGDLPCGIAALCSTQVGVQDLTIEAAVHGSRRLALEALLVDPVVDSLVAAEKTLDELLRVHAPYLSLFKM